MKCTGCGAENREGSNYCRFCAAPLTETARNPEPGYIPSVPPPSSRTFGDFYTPPSYQTPVSPPARISGQLVCPRCGSTKILKGGIPVWAIVVAVVGFLVVLCFSLLFLLIKDPHKCLNCGLEFK
jgi:hypothetical protein